MRSKDTHKQLARTSLRSRDYFVNSTGRIIMLVAVSELQQFASLFEVITKRLATIY